jgi:hypothetical protein
MKKKRLKKSAPIKRKRPVKIKKHDYQGYTLKSGLELVMFKELENNNIPFDYEKLVFKVSEPFTFKNKSYEKFLNGKGEFKNRGGKSVKGMTYTPDFTSEKGRTLRFIIETKGRATQDFAMRWKLFKKSLEDDNIVLFMPRTKADCVKTANYILKNELF